MVDVKSLEALGEMFKTKREIEGLTRRDVVMKLKIPMDQLESIEEGRLSSLPPVYAKGFLRAYANELHMDAEGILEEYRRMTGGFKNEPASREPLSPKYVESSVGVSSSFPTFKLLIVLAVIAGATTAGYFISPDFRTLLTSVVPFMEKVDSGDQATGQPGAPEESGSPTREADNPAPTPPNNSTPASESTTTSAHNPTVPGTVATPPSTPMTVLPGTTGPGGTLVLTCLKDTWADIVVDGHNKEHVNFKAGYSKTWENAKAIRVVVGNASAIKATWNGLDLGDLGGSMAVELKFPPK